VDRFIIKLNEICESSSISIEFLKFLVVHDWANRNYPMEWTRLFPLTAPESRRRMTLSAWKHYIFMFGGYSDEGILNQFYSFDTITLRWNLIQNFNESIITKLSGHASLVYNDSLYVIMGEGGQSLHLLNDVIRYDFHLKKWYQITTNVPPVSRFFHAVALHNDEFYMDGGYNGRSDYDSTFYDFWKFSLQDDTWTEVMEQFGDIPPRMLSHSLVGISHSLYLYGGVYDHVSSYTTDHDLYVFNILNGIWKCLQLDNAPSPRCNTIMISFKNCFCMFGGYDETPSKGKESQEESKARFKNDLFVFDTRNDRWREIGLKNSPIQRTKHSGTINCNGKLYTYGGLSREQENLNDMWCIDVFRDPFQDKLLECIVERTFADLIFKNN
jgi:N-acetylneuraminic acid mutarotase